MGTEDNKKMHIWMTDNNGQLGTRSKKCKNIGKHVRTKICSKGNGANLKKTLQNRKMRAMNTFLKAAEDKDEETEKLTTWRSINGKQKGQIDYINIDTHKANWVERIDYIGNANPRSNNGHKAIMMTIRQKRKKEPKKEKEIPQHVKYDIMKMRKEYENQKYKWEKIHEKIKKVKETKMSTKKETDKIWEKTETEIRKQIIEKTAKKKERRGRGVK